MLKLAEWILLEFAKWILNADQIVPALWSLITKLLSSRHLLLVYIVERHPIMAMMQSKSRNGKILSTHKLTTFDAELNDSVTRSLLVALW